jgi:hypothetical protein
MKVCFWHASTSVLGLIFVSVRIRTSLRFKTFLCFILVSGTPLRCLHIPQGEYHWYRDWEVLRNRNPRGALAGSEHVFLSRLARSQSVYTLN